MPPRRIVAGTEEGPYKGPPSVLHFRGSASEHEAHSNLPVPRTVVLATDRPEGTAPKVGARAAESGRIQEVEEFAPDFRTHTLPNFELLTDAEVERMDPRSATTGEVAGCVTGNLVSGAREGTEVEVVGGFVHYRVNARPTARVARKIGTLAPVAQQIVVHTDVDGPTGLERNKSCDAPASDQGIEAAVHLPAHPPATPDR